MQDAEAGSERYLCPLKVKYANSTEVGAATFIFNFDMPVIRKDDGWYPTAQFFSLFLEALEKEKQNKAARAASSKQS